MDSNRWRVGRKVPINVYAGNRPVCQCQTPEFARLIVEAVNAKLLELNCDALVDEVYPPDGPKMKRKKERAAARAKPR